MKHLMNNSYKKLFHYAVVIILIFIFSVIQSFADDEWELVSVIGRGAIYELDLSPDDSMLAVATTIGVWIYDSQTFEVLHFFVGSIESRDKIDWSPDSKQLAIGRDDGLDIWNLETGEHITLFKEKSIISVAWSPDGSTLALALREAMGTTVRFWDVIENRLLQDIDNIVGTIAWSPDGRLIAIGGGESIHVVDSQTGEQLTYFRLSNRAYEWPIYSIVWSPDSNQIATTSEDGRLRVWDVVNSKNLNTIYEQSSSYSNVVWSQDGAKIATGDGRKSYIYDAESFELLMTVEDDLPGIADVRWYYDAVDSAHVAWSSDGKTLYTAGWKEYILAWDTETGELMRHTDSHFRFINTMAWSPIHNILATSSPDLSIRLWGGKTGEHMASFYGHEDTIESLAWSPDGTRLVSGALDNRRGSPPRQYSETYAQTVRIWDMETNSLIFALEGHNGSVTHVAWSPDSTQLASGSDDKTIRIWDTTTGKELHVFAAIPNLK